MARLKDTEINGNLVVTGDLLNKDGVDLTTAFSNPNLLINSDFRKPINQRGQTSYNNNAQTWTRVYTIDRWYLSGENGTTLNVGDGYIEIVATKNCWLIQPFEKSIDGKYITTINVLEISGSATYHDIELTSGLNVIDGEGKFNDCGIYLTAGTTIKLEYIKLEQGSIATPFVPRPYAEELALCKRYYQLHNQVMFAKSTSDTYFWGSNLSVEMRVDPTLEKYMLYTSSAKDVTSSFGSCTVWNRMLYLIILKSPISDSALRCSLWLDAEIY